MASKGKLSNARRHKGNTITSFATGFQKRSLPQRGGRAAEHRKQNLTRVKAVQEGSRHKVELARRFYEDAWSVPNLDQLDGIIDAFVTEGHVQEDQVWQKKPRRGKESIKNGIRFIRRWYPDARFTVEEAALTEDGQRVFVKWTMVGTYDGEQDVSSGLALLTIDNSLISRTEVFRQATKAEVEAAKRSQDGPVEQGLLLGKT